MSRGRISTPPNRAEQRFCCPKVTLARLVHGGFILSMDVV
uniref:Uncharacterized protein n=1 Tax=Arundo donax TaxID=35708 RepID=A0A0A9DPC7_ARUDO